MPKTLLQPAEVAERLSAGANGWLDRQAPAGLERFEDDLPRLYEQGARTVARDRWERIVTTNIIPAPPQRIWRALTDPLAIKRWFIACHGSLEQEGQDCVLDFGDGDFFLCRPVVVSPPHYLEWRWRWLGIGPAWTVKWQLEEVEGGTRVTVLDEAFNPPTRTGHYRGEGWPEILDILAAFVRTGTDYRWPVRSQSYVISEVPATVYGAWDRLFNPAALKWWLHVFAGSVAEGQTLDVHMGDASGNFDLTIKQVGPPSYHTYPFVTFSMKRPYWPAEVPGRLFMEPGGWGASILQVYQTGWENLGPALQLTERQVIVGYWAEAFRRARQLCSGQGMPARATPWVLSEHEAGAASRQPPLLAPVVMDEAG
jgi:uncharacterized protein YndB with AHSA1/START domain